MSSLAQESAAACGTIVRRVRVDRSRTPQQTLAATGRRQHVDNTVVADMPRGEGDEATVFFFKVGRYISDTDLEKVYASRGRKPADPYTLAAVNEADPAFADDHPNCTHWKNPEDQWCYAAFNRWGDDEGDVDINRCGFKWNDFWWFAGQ